MLLVFLAGLLPFFLFALAIDTGVIKTAGSSAPIKKILADSGIYNSLISGVLDQAKTSGGDQGGGVSLTDPAIKQAAQNTFTPQFLQQNTEKFLDSIFVWLDGQTPSPDFRIDLSSLKTTFAAEAAKVAVAKVATLPVCPTGLSGSADSFDVFSASCLPRGLTPAQVAAEVQNAVASSEGFIKEPVITADAIKSSGSSQSIFADQLKGAPDAYQKVKKTPIILGILSLLTIAAIIFLSSSRAAGLRRVGISLVGAGIFLLIFAWSLNYGVNQKALPQLKLDNKVLEEKIRALVSDITQNINRNNRVFGVSYAALGALGIGGSIFIRRRGNHAAHEHTAAGRETIEAKQPEEPEPKPRPPRNPPPKIQ